MSNKKTEDRPLSQYDALRAQMAASIVTGVATNEKFGHLGPGAWGRIALGVADDILKEIHAQKNLRQTT
jgi:hypothetical protein